jgi:inner membrane protein
MADVRMGMEPHYVFTFAVATGRPGGPLQPAAPTELVGTRLDVASGLRWLLPRTFGEPLPPPR